MNKLPIFHKGKSGGINFSNGYDNNSSVYLFSFFVIIFVFFVILIIRLFQVTVVKGEYYRRLSENNRIREFIIEPKRGKIIDRKGFVIAQNSEADIKQNKERLSSTRSYQSAEAIAPLIGYRQIADKNDIATDNCLNKLKIGDKVGKKGAEKIFDCQLRGRYGKKLVEVDVSGNYLQTLSVISPQDGQNIQLALDLDLQQKTYDLIKNKQAAVVGIKPQTGEILILSSSPSFNPQDFEDGNSNAINSYFQNQEKPIFNRATEGTYPPGSIFKLVVATAALEEKKVDKNTQIEDTGSIKAGPISFGNWYFLQYGKTEGMVNLTKAIKRSNDIYFYKIGELLGPEKIKLWAEKFGYGKPSGIGIEESEGTLPSPFWKEEKLNEKWYLGDTYNFSIGQGYALSTPLQTTVATAAIANDGIFCKPKLIKTGSAYDKLLEKYEKPECYKLPISKTTLDLLRQGMEEACSTGGTGWPLFDFKVNQNVGTRLTASDSESNEDGFDKSKPYNNSTDSANLKPIQTACKTGTAESHAKSGTPHAWFTVYAPSDNPEIALSIIIEEGGQGSDVAAPIAHDILKAYFERSE